MSKYQVAVDVVVKLTIDVYALTATEAIHEAEKKLNEHDYVTVDEQIDVHLDTVEDPKTTQLELVG